MFLFVYSERWHAGSPCQCCEEIQLDTVLYRLLTFISKHRTLVQIARDPVILKRQRHSDETEIEDEHGHSQDLAHLPAGHQDREENKKKH